MSSQQQIQQLQTVFRINAIYAKRVLDMTLGQLNYLDEARKIIQEKPKPFVKWVGGKRQLLKQFRDLGLYPPDGFDPYKATYFEPFVGGGAVFFDLLPKHAILSDMNFELVSAYIIIRDNVDQLIQSLKKTENTKEYFLKVRAEDPKKLSSLDVASRFIYLNRTCFNGLYRVNKSGGFNTPYGKYKNPMICDESNLRRISEILQEVEILHQDYKQVLKKAKKGDFIYFDPPYYPISKTSSFTSYTAEAFLDKEQLELRDTFVTLHKRGCFVMLSNSDTSFINEIYSGIEGVKINKIFAGRAINAKASGRGKITEVIITNYL